VSRAATGRKLIEAMYFNKRSIDASS